MNYIVSVKRYNDGSMEVNKPIESIEEMKSSKVEHDNFVEEINVFCRMLFAMTFYRNKLTESKIINLRRKR